MTLSGAAIFAAPGLYRLARPVAATKVENSASRAQSHTNAVYVIFAGDCGPAGKPSERRI